MALFALVFFVFLFLLTLFRFVSFRIVQVPEGSDGKAANTSQTVSEDETQLPVASISPRAVKSDVGAHNSRLASSSWPHKEGKKPQQGSKPRAGRKGVGPSKKESRNRSKGRGKPSTASASAKQSVKSHPSGPKPNGSNGSSVNLSNGMSNPMMGMMGMMGMLDPGSLALMWAGLQGDPAACASVQNMAVGVASGGAQACMCMPHKPLAVRYSKNEKEGFFKAAMAARTDGCGSDQGNNSSSSRDESSLSRF